MFSGLCFGLQISLIIVSIIGGYKVFNLKTALIDIGLGFSS